MVAVALLDYRQLRLYAPVLYAVSGLGLLIVLTPLGTIVNGAYSWISLPGGFQIEPSEYAPKLSIILISAMLLSELRPGRPAPAAARGGNCALAFAAVPIVLVEAEPDLGVVILMLALIIGLIALSGVRLYWLGAGLGAAALTVVAVINLHLIRAYQAGPADGLLAPVGRPAGHRLQRCPVQDRDRVRAACSARACSTAELVSGNFVPEQHTDFIFAVVGNELGFIGAMIIIALLGLMLMRALRIAARADDQFGMLVAAGIAIWFAVQAFVNIGMTMGIMPVTGLPLPFVSYGGSAIFADMIAVGGAPGRLPAPHGLHLGDPATPRGQRASADGGVVEERAQAADDDVQCPTRTGRRRSRPPSWPRPPPG